MFNKKSIFSFLTIIALVFQVNVFSRNNNVVVANGLLTGSDAIDVPVILQDGTTPPVDVFFTRSISNFSLSNATEQSGVTNLVFTFTASNGHAIATNNEILLLDVIGDRSFHAEVLGVSGDLITLDRPIDHAFPADSLCRIVSTEMAVNGSVTPVIFSLRAGTTPIDFTRFIAVILDSSTMDDGLFGGIAELTKGVVFRIVDGYNWTGFNWKKNGDFKQWTFDGNYKLGLSGPSGTDSFTTRLTFNGAAKHGVVLRISTGDVIQVIIQDDLTALGSFKISAMGHKTSGEMD